MLFSVVFLLIIIIVILILSVLRRRSLSEKWQMRFKQLKQKVFYNSIIRYFIINYLKFNFLSAAILATSPERNNADFILAIIAFICINSMPLVFCFILHRHQHTLADESDLNSFGTLYAGRNVKPKSHKVQFLPLTFFYRRTIVVLVTVYVFDNPNLQFISFHVITILTIVYHVSDSSRFATQA